MKLEKNKLNLEVDFSNIENLKMAFEKICASFKSGTISGQGSGGDYYQYKYDIIKDSVIYKEPECLGKISLDSQIKLGTRITDGLITIPSKMNFEYE